MYPNTVMSSFKDQMLLFSTYYSSLVFRRSWFRISPKRLVMLTDILQAWSCKINYYCFLPYCKLWIFVCWIIWSVCYSASWNFMHASTKHSEFPLHFQLLKILPRKNSSQSRLMVGSTLTTISRRISITSWYSGQARTVSTMSWGKE
jgi:hypothetical protein